MLLAHMPRGAELEDLLQDVASIMVSRIGEVREAGALRGWLRTVALNVARSTGRRHRVAGRGLLERWRMGLSAGNGAGTDDTESHSEEGRLVLLASAELPEGYREPLLLRAVRGMSYRQIAEVMGLPETTIENRIVRGRRMLKELLEKGIADGADETGQSPPAAGNGVHRAVEGSAGRRRPGTIKRDGTACEILGAAS